LTPIIVENELSSCVEITNNSDIVKTVKKIKKREIKWNQKLKESKKKTTQSTLDLFIARTLKENRAKKAEIEAATVYKSLNMYESSIGLTEIGNSKERTKKHILNGLGYVMLYFLKANVTWQALGNGPYSKSKFKSMKMLIKDLCVSLPKEYLKYLKYCRELKFEDGPCATDLEKLFRNIRKGRDFEANSHFDWFTKTNRCQKVQTVHTQIKSSANSETI
jgi:hypothetical protein